MIGQRLAHYEIKAKLAKGGMGEVYRAHDSKLGRDVALKLLPAERANDPERIQRLEREAKAIAALSHPNIVTIHSVEEADGQHFLTMELVEGRTLFELIPSGGMALDGFFEIAIPLADALSAAHAKGILHRDLKPSNLMIDGNGRLKVLDFGLAKLFSLGSEELDATLIQSAPAEEPMTAEGKILGTMCYMSPEQAESKPLDARSDIFSLGIVLYEMATGERPFQGDTPVSTISSILKDAPAPVTERKATLPRHLGRVIGRCLEKKPEKRYQTARDVCNELEGLQKEIQSGEVEAMGSGLHSREQFAPTAKRSGRSLWPWLALAGLATVMAVIYFAFLRPAAPTQKDFKTVPFTSAVGVEYPGSWSPDGSFVVYSHSAQGPLDLFVASVAGGEPMELVRSPYDNISARWSPDNRWIAFVTARQRTAGIYLVPPLGGEAQLLTDTGLPRLDAQIGGALGATPWSPDGSTLVFARRDDQGRLALWKIALATREETQLTQPGVAEMDFAAAYSNAGDRIMFCRSNGSQCQLLVMPAEGGSASKALAIDSYYALPSWSPDDRHIVYDLRGKGIMQLDLRSGATIRLSTGGDESGTVVSRGGRILYSTDTHQTDLYEQTLLDGSTRRLTRHTKDNFSAEISPNGQQLVYESTRTGNSELWLLELSSGNERQLTQTETDEWGPEWTPDGSEILYGTGQGSAMQLHSVSAAGGPARRLGSYEAAGGNPQATPDGTQIGFLVNEAESTSLHVVDRGGGESRAVFHGLRDFVWYKDAQHLVYTPGDADRSDQIRAVDLQSGADVLLLDTPHREVAISRDGTQLSYCSSLSHYNMNLFVVSLRPARDGSGLPEVEGAPIAATTGDGEWHVHNGSIAADGTRVFYTRDTDTADLYILDGAF